MEIGIDTSPYGNGQAPFPYGEPDDMAPRFYMEIPYRNGYPFPNGEGPVTNPFPDRVCFHLGIEVKIPIWEYFL
jgi:hypothetical protein